MAWGSGSVGRLRGGRRACGAVRAACWVEGQVFDVHDPLDATDGIDVDVPQAIAGLSGRIGGALGSALAFNRIPSHTSPDQRQLALSSAGESSVERALAAVQQLDGSTAIGARLDQLADASQRGDRLVRLASSLPRGDVSAAELAASLAGAFRTGLSTSVTVNPA